MNVNPWADLEDFQAPSLEVPQLTKRGTIPRGHANLGKTLESLVEVAIATYRHEKRALLEKQEIPWTVIGFKAALQKCARIFLRGRSSVDYHGAYTASDGARLAVWFDAKECNDPTYFHIGDKQIKQHQIDWLLEAQAQGDAAFFLVWLTEQDRAFLVDPAWIDTQRRTVARTVKRKGQPLPEKQYRTSIRHEDLAAIGYEVPWRDGFPDFLATLDRIRSNSANT